MSLSDYLARIVPRTLLPKICEGAGIWATIKEEISGARAKPQGHIGEKGFSLHELHVV
jgi:hypothetical protein